jgi:hypothetical protein
MADLNRPTKRLFELGRQVGVHAVRANEQGDANLDGHEQRHNRKRQLPPLAQHLHIARKFRRLACK